VTGTLKGKQRNTCGPYLVYNNNLQQIKIDKFTSSGLGTALTYTSTVDSAVQLLGSHEVYWWGWGK